MFTLPQLHNVISLLAQHNRRNQSPYSIANPTYAQPPEPQPSDTTGLFGAAPPTANPFGAPAPAPDYSNLFNGSQAAPDYTNLFNAGPGAPTPSIPGAPTGDFAALVAWLAAQQTQNLFGGSPTQDYSHLFSGSPATPNLFGG